MKNFTKKHGIKLVFGLMLLIIIGLSWALYESSKLYNHLVLPRYQYFEISDSYVSVEGTWVSNSPEGLANELQTVKITCDKARGTCQETVADTVFDLLSIYTSESVITSWDDNFILFETVPGNTSCVKYSYRIDRFKKELSAIRTSTNNSSELCRDVSPELKLRLVDGLEVILELRGQKK